MLVNTIVRLNIAVVIISSSSACSVQRDLSYGDLTIVQPTTQKELQTAQKELQTKQVDNTTDKKGTIR